MQPIADRMAHTLYTISKNFQFSTRILMGSINSTIYYVVLIANPIGRNLAHWKSLRNHLEILCHPIWNLVYIQISDLSHLCLMMYMYEDPISLVRCRCINIIIWCICINIISLMCINMTSLWHNEHLQICICINIRYLLSLSIDVHV